MKQFKILFLFLAVAFTACESMDETFDAGERARSVGKCSDLNIETGWKRVKLSWTNNVDPAIEFIHLYGLQGADTVLNEMLPAGTTTFETEANLTSSSVQYSLVAIDLDGNRSLTTSLYARAYDYDSEQVTLWQTMRRAHYFVNDGSSDRLLLFLYDGYTVSGTDTTWAVLDAKIKYTLGSGELVERNLDKGELSKSLIIIDGIDKTKDITLEKTMKLEECYDIISFDPVVLAKEGDKDFNNYSPDFLNNIKTRYDYATNDQAIAALDTLTTLYFDRDISSFENIMYMPNLKKVYLGYNRIMGSSYSRNATYCAKITDDIESSMLALETMFERRGVTVNAYGNHYDMLAYKATTEGKKFVTYSTGSRSYISADFLPTADQIGTLDEETASIAGGWQLSTYASVDASGSLKALIGGNLATNMFGVLLLTYSDLGNFYWRPMMSADSVRSHEIVYDLLEEKDIKGFFFRQCSQTSEASTAMYPEAIEAYYSADGRVWNPIYDNFSSVYVGTSPAEVTFIEPVKEIKGQYIKLVVSDKVSTGGNYVIVSKFFPYFN
ncbi:MAG: DUF4998 domain-containing protein [Mangrovibacterium sp.]